MITRPEDPDQFSTFFPLTGFEGKLLNTDYSCVLQVTRTVYGYM